MLLIFAVAVLIRVSRLAHMGLTFDEINNSIRGAAFGDALISLLQGKFDPDDWYFYHTGIADKPGIPIAYLIGIGGIFPYIKGIEFPDYLFHIRLPFVLIGGLSCVVLYLLVKELFNTKTALVSALLLALEPFHAGLSQIAGPDSTTTFFTLVTLWTFMRGLKTRRWLWWCLSAIAMGLGTLTKLQTVIIVPILLIWFFFFSERENYIKTLQSAILFFSERENYIKTLKSALRLLVPFCAVALITFYLLWPWLWPNPPYRTLDWLLDVFRQAVGGHRTFYLGQQVRDPGWSYYPVVLMFQLTAPEFIGIFLFLFFLLWDRPYGYLWKKRIEILAVFSWITLYILFMTMIPKKLGARYILAVFPAVLIFSALGWISLIERLSRQSLSRTKKIRVRSVQILLSITLLGLQAYPLVAETPDYYYNYFNPLLGGSKTAARVQLIGLWGEGLNEIAQYFNAKNEIASKEHTVMVIGFVQIFNEYYKGPPAPLLQWERKSEIYSLEDVLRNFDYIVFQLTFVQLRWHENFWIYFSEYTPEYTLQAYGLTLYWIFPIPPIV